jgi:hypothetical protein
MANLFVEKVRNPLADNDWIPLRQVIKDDNGESSILKTKYFDPQSKELLHHGVSGGNILYPIGYNSGEITPITNTLIFERGAAQSLTGGAPLALVNGKFKIAESSLLYGDGQPLTGKVVTVDKGIPSVTSTLSGITIDKKSTVDSSTINNSTIENSTIKTSSMLIASSNLNITSVGSTKVQANPVTIENNQIKTISRTVVSSATEPQDPNVLVWIQP